jgi:hypothetical protein
MGPNGTRNRGEHDSMTFKTWVINLFEDERQRTSIKPVIALLGSLILCGTMIVNSLHPSFVPASYLVDAVMIITAIGMGADSLDKFSLRGRNTGISSSNDYNDDSGQYSNPNSSPDNKIGQSSTELL